MRHATEISTRKFVRSAREDENAVNVGWSAIAPAALLGLVFASGVAAQQPQQQPQQQQPVPDAPTPQAPTPLPGVNGPITPGLGSAGAPSNSSSAAGQQPPEQPTPPPAPQNQAPVTQQPPDNTQTTPPDQGAAALVTFRTYVNFVEVPVTVKDSKGNIVSGLGWRDFKVYEDNSLQHLDLFSVDPRPLSIAFIIDQTLTSNVMARVNQSLSAIQGALAPYDEVAVFSYTNGAKEWTGFTGAQGQRLPAVLSLAQAIGTDPMVPDNGGDPFSACSLTVNGNCPDPNLQPGRSTQAPGWQNLPKENHTLNDAILAAAKELSTRPKERLRMIYVVSDGKEYGSKAKLADVLRYLETNNIAVFGTLVGDSARWGEGWLDRFHLPFTMYDNVLYKYTAATGGDLYSEGNVNGMEKSYAKVADEARSQYTLGYRSHASPYDERLHVIDVRVDRPDVVVDAKRGYRNSGQTYK
jgi:VWFA-related protein